MKHFLCAIIGFILISLCLSCGTSRNTMTEQTQYAVQTDSNTDAKQHVNLNQSANIVTNETDLTDAVITFTKTEYFDDDDADEVEADVQRGTATKRDREQTEPPNASKKRGRIKSVTSGTINLHNNKNTKTDSNFNKTEDATSEASQSVKTSEDTKTATSVKTQPKSSFLKTLGTCAVIVFVLVLLYYVVRIVLNVLWRIRK